MTEIERKLRMINIIVRLDYREIAEPSFKDDYFLLKKLCFGYTYWTPRDLFKVLKDGKEIKKEDMLAINKFIKMFIELLDKYNVTFEELKRYYYTRKNNRFSNEEVDTVLELLYGKNE